MIIDLDKEPSLVREFLTSEKTMKELALTAGFDTPNKLKKEINKLKNFEYFTVKTKQDVEELADESNGNICYYYRAQGINKTTAMKIAVDLVAPEEYLYEKYHNKGMTPKEIAEEISLWLITEKVIRVRIELLGITHKDGAYSDIARRSWKDKQSRLEKVKSTNMAKYGVEFTTQTPEMKKKTRQTMLNKYGVEHPLQHSKFVNKAKKTIENRYMNPESDEFIRYGFRASNSWHKTPYVETYQEAIELIEPDSNGESVKLKALLKKLLDDKVFTSITLKTLSEDIVGLPRWYYTNPPYNIHPDGELIVSNYRGEQSELVKFITDIGIDKSDIIIDNFYDFMGGKQLDAYIPKYNFAIEFNGTFWHASAGKGLTSPKDKSYHIDKTNKANAEGIDLMYIWDYEWENPTTREIIKSQIRHRLGKDKQKYYARETYVKRISDADSKSFLSRTNREGSAEKGVSFGLYYKDVLLAVMAINKVTKEGESYTEITRFSVEINTSVVGGFSKLLTHILKESNNTLDVIIESPVDYLDTQNSNTLALLGFDNQYIAPSQGIWLGANDRDKVRRYKVYDTGMSISTYRVNKRGV